VHFFNAQVYKDTHKIIMEYILKIEIFKGKNIALKKATNAS